MTKLKKAVGKSLAALGVAGIAVAGTAGAAFAAVGPDQPDHPETGSLTIHKYEGAAGSVGDGTEQDMTGRTALGGVKFKIWQLGIENDEGTCVALDMSSRDDWAPIADITDKAAPGTVAGVASDGFCYTDVTGADLLDPNPTEGTTDVNGVILFDNGGEGLPLSLYYVQETDASGAWEGTPDNKVSVVSESVPFYVTVPLPKYSEEEVCTGEGDDEVCAPQIVDGEWVYDVHAYPKNQTAEAPSKSVETQGLVIGSDVDWTIEGEVPSLEDETKFNEGSIYDNLDGRLAYKSSVLTLGGAQVYPTPDGAEELVTFSNNDGDLTWTFVDPKGLEFLDANQGENIELVITTTVKAAFGDGEIPNDDYGFSWNGVTIPGSPTPYTYWGALKVTKVDQDGAALKGAVFEVYPATGTPAACSAEVPTSGKVSTGTSDANGLVNWTPNVPDNGSPLGLWIADSDDGALTSPSKMYCLYETVVPSGYTGMQGAKEITVTPGVETSVDLGNDVTVKNTIKTGPPLPPTGANGTTLMVIGGVALVSLAGGLYMVNRRKTTQA